MADNKDATSFFRKVVKFVANPATEWTELGSRPPAERDNELAKTELKSMIERKRRNDFVRKREFDMLRKVRREGLTGEQLAALGGSSRLDDSEGRMPESGARAESGVKAKIDEIEQQMVGDGYGGRPRARSEMQNAPTQPAGLADRPPRTAAAHKPAAHTPAPRPAAAEADHLPSPALARGDRPGERPGDRLAESRHGVMMSPGLTPLSSSAFDQGGDLAAPLSADASEVMHDPELDEAVIAFANADFEQCEQALIALTGPGGVRAEHAESWLALFDLYRAIGQQQKFEGLALDYARQFGWSAPQWFSMPRMVAEAAGDERPRASRIDGQVGWVCPPLLDADAVARLRSQTLQMPLPWVFDWSALGTLDAEAASRLSELFRGWIGQKLDMRWIAGDQLLAVLHEAAPVGVRDADPAFWQLRLEVLRMTNRPDQFDEAAIDYCVTYEVSPPSWERAECRVRVSSGKHSTTAHTMSVISELSTSFVESVIGDDTELMQVASVELSGQLVGDISDMLARLDKELGASSRLQVSCVRLIRVDFIAAGDLLNWVLSRRGENRHVAFVDAHRLVALFFGAMGINEHASIKLRNL